jgi:hypothetical protein
MQSKKITQLPTASIINSDSLLAIVTNGVTEKATVSQLPLGITSVNNLGAGVALGTIVTTALNLKTIVPGVGIAFTNTTNTLTISNALNVSNVGSGTPLINSFTNPNLALKSITSSNGITVTDNTTSINISSSINNALDSIIGLIEVAIIKRYKLETFINKAYTVNKIFLLTASGSATVRVISQSSLSVDVMTSNTFTANNTRSENIINSFTTSVGQQLVLEIVTNNVATELSFAIDLTYI